MCFSSPLSWGITGCSGALRCRVCRGGLGGVSVRRVVGGGGVGGGIRGAGSGGALMLIPLYTDYTLAPLAHPWPGPQPLQRSPTVAGISPDKQLKEL